MYYANDVVEQLRASKKIVIYGARIVANEVANCLMSPPYNLHIDAFMVSDKEGNPDELVGIKVINVAEGIPYYKQATVIVAVLEKYEADILGKLSILGFKNVISLTFESDLWSEIRGNYFKEKIESEARNI